MNEPSRPPPPEGFESWLDYLLGPWPSEPVVERNLAAARAELAALRKNQATVRRSVRPEFHIEENEEQEKRMSRRYGLTAVGSIVATDARAPAACTIEEAFFDGDDFVVRPRMPRHDEGDDTKLTGLDETTLVYSLSGAVFADENGTPLAMNDCLAVPGAVAIVKALTMEAADTIVEFRFHGAPGDTATFAVAAADTV